MTWAALGASALGFGSTAVWLQVSGAARPRGLELTAILAAICLVGAATLVNLLLRWLRWQFLWRRLGVALPARNSALMFTAMLPAVLTPFAIGEVMVALLLKRYSATPWRLAWASWSLSRLADAAALAVIAGLYSWSGWIVLGLLLTLAMLAMSAETIPAGRPGSLVGGAAGGIVFVALTICAWLLPGLGLWAACLLIDGSGNLAAHVSLLASSTLLGALTLLPGGVVATGGLMVDGLVALGMPLRSAVHVVLATRAGTVGVSLLIGGLVWLVWHRALRDLMLSRQRAAQAHFDELSSSYADEIPAHVRDRLLGRKVALLRSTLASNAMPPPARGFDLGCGQGWYAIEMARHGFAMHGGDLSAGQLSGAAHNAKAAGVAIELHQLGGAGLPMPDASLDFVYAINVIHHVTAPDVRARLLADVVRVLRPGGVFVLHEINTRNPLFRLYMSYLFPLVRNIDDGTEVWIEPDAPPAVPGAQWEPRASYFTFLPDFVPPAVMDRLLWLERWLESSRFDVWSAHYQIVLRKNLP